MSSETNPFEKKSNSKLTPPAQLSEKAKLDSAESSAENLTDFAKKMDEVVNQSSVEETKEDPAENSNQNSDLELDLEKEEVMPIMNTIGPVTDNMVRVANMTQPFNIIIDGQVYYVPKGPGIMDKGHADHWYCRANGLQVFQ